MFPSCEALIDFVRRSFEHVVSPHCTRYYVFKLCRKAILYLTFVKNGNPILDIFGGFNWPVKRYKGLTKMGWGNYALLALKRMTS